MTRQDFDRSHHLGNQNLIRTILVQLFSNFRDIVLERRFFRKLKEPILGLPNQKREWNKYRKLEKNMVSGMSGLITSWSCIWTLTAMIR